MKYNHIVEVGCNSTMSLDQFIHDAAKVEIIEPNPDHIAYLQTIYAARPNITVHPFAICDKDGPVKFYKEGVTSYVAGIKCPALCNNWFEDREENAIVVEGRTFDHFDDGTIDIIDIDTEGSEWYVIKRMISRPQIIIVEMEWVKYRNPHFDDIKAWMEQNHYVKFHSDGGSFFYRKFI